MVYLASQISQSFDVIRRVRYFEYFEHLSITHFFDLRPNVAVDHKHHVLLHTHFDPPVPVIFVFRILSVFGYYTYPDTDRIHDAICVPGIIFVPGFICLRISSINYIGCHVR